MKKERKFETIKKDDNVFDLILAITLGLSILVLLFLLFRFYVLLYMNQII